MGMRRQVLPYLIATSLLTAPVAAMGARVADLTTNLTVLTYGTMPVAPGYALKNGHDVTAFLQIVEADLWDELELAVSELADEFELIVATDEDGYELALPDYSDGLELAQAQSFGIGAEGLDDQ